MNQITQLAAVIGEKCQIQDTLDEIQEAMKNNDFATAYLKIGYLIACCDKLKNVAMNLFNKIKEEQS